jgi:hypothetical protein
VLEDHTAGDPMRAELRRPVSANLPARIYSTLADDARIVVH